MSGVCVHLPALRLARQPLLSSSPTANEGAQVGMVSPMTSPCLTVRASSRVSGVVEEHAVGACRADLVDDARSY